jgi:putative protein kinase ArgK-like GTPase of G3E family
MPFSVWENMREQKEGIRMLTPKQEQYCKNRAIKKLSQRQAYLDAYPNSKEWQPETVDTKACNLEKEDKILARLKELRDEETAKMSKEAKWNREKAYNELIGLINRAKNEMDDKEEMSSPTVSAIINAVKELNNIYAVGEKSEGGGVLDDILQAVRGITND